MIEPAIGIYIDDRTIYAGLVDYVHSQFIYNILNNIIRLHRRAHGYVIRESIDLKTQVISY